MAIWYVTAVVKVVVCVCVWGGVLTLTMVYVFLKNSRKTNTRMCVCVPVCVRVCAQLQLSLSSPLVPCPPGCVPVMPVHSLSHEDRTSVSPRFHQVGGNIQRCRWVCDSMKPSSVDCTLTLELTSVPLVHTGAVQRSWETCDVTNSTVVYTSRALAAACSD